MRYRKLLVTIFAVSFFLSLAMSLPLSAGAGDEWSSEDKSTDIYIQNAVEASSDNDFEQALMYTEKAIELQPDNPKLYKMKAGYHFKLNQVDAGVAALDKSIELDPSDYFTYIYKSLNLSHYGMYEEHLAWSEVMIERFPNDCRPYEEKNWALTLQHRSNEEMLEWLDEALAKMPGCSRLAQDKAMLLIDMGRLDEAIPLLEHAAEHGASYDASLYILGHAYMKSKQYDKAIDAYERAGEKDPYDAQTALVLKAKALAHKGDVNEAIALLDAELSKLEKHPQKVPEHAVDGENDDPGTELLEGKAEILVYAGRYYEAMAVYDELAEKDNDYNCDICFKVPLLVALGNFDEAMSVIGSSSEPGGEDAAEMRMWVNIEMGEIEDAVRYMETVVKDMPKNARMHRDLGYALIFAERYDEAVKSLDKSLELDGSDGEAMIYKALAMMKRDDEGDFEAAEKMLKDLVEKPGFDYYEQKASAYALLGEKENMLKELETLTDGEPIKSILIKTAPEFEPYLADPDFMEIVGK